MIIGYERNDYYGIAGRFQKLNGSNTRVEIINDFFATSNSRLFDTVRIRRPPGQLPAIAYRTFVKIVVSKLLFSR